MAQGLRELHRDVRRRTSILAPLRTCRATKVDVRPNPRMLEIAKAKTGKIRRGVRQLMAEPYKYFLGAILAMGQKLNYFDFPRGKWPPPTPARAYISEFLSLYENDVRGRCLEFFPGVYKKRFLDVPSVTSFDIWNVEPDVEVTIVGDLQQASYVPDASFDTIICTHVLCCIPRPWLAVMEMHRMLSPGGLVLCTNPAILQKYAPHPADYWRFTKDSMKMLFTEFAKVNVHSYGNAVTVAASPFFLMSKHLPKKVLETQDEYCPSIVAVAAWK
jgi:SAM-dependent methyltransferase